MTRGHSYVGRSSRDALARLPLPSPRAGRYPYLSAPVMDAVVRREPKRRLTLAALGYALFWLLLVLPVSANGLKGVLIGIVVSIFLIEASIGGALKMHPTVLLWFLYYVGIGVCWALLGGFRHNPGAVFSSMVYVLWPAIYGVFVARANDLVIVRTLLRLCVFATLCIGVSVMYYVSWDAGFIPDALYVDLGTGGGINYYSGFTQMRFYAISSLIFLVPFLIASLLILPGVEVFVGRTWIWLALGVGSVLVFLSGRIALMVNVAVAPFAAILFGLMLPSGDQRKGVAQAWKRIPIVVLFVVLSGALLAGTVQWNWASQWAFITEGFDFQKGSESAAVRREQFEPLIRGWADEPLFGQGLGAVTPGVVRNEERPWEYELQYVLMLFQMGVIGTLAYSAGVVWMYRMSFKIIGSGGALGRYMAVVLVGTTCFLIANATNPYLQAYGHLWVLYLPIAMINIWLLSGRPGRGSANRSL